MRKIVLTLLSLALAAIVSAQDWSAEKLLADPDKNLGKKVTIFIYKVDVPAINATEDVDYRDFAVYTAKKGRDGFEGGGYIVVRVFRKDAGNFTKKYGASTDYKNAKIFTDGIFRSGNGRFLVDATAGVPRTGDSMGQYNK